MEDRQLFEVLCKKTRILLAPVVCSGYHGPMDRVESETQVTGSALTQTEAAALISVILANTSTSAPVFTVPDSLMSLADYFPEFALVGV